MKILQKRIKFEQDPTPETKYLSVQDISEAELVILRWVQRQVFPNELNQLEIEHKDNIQSRAISVRKNSSLYKLDPYVEDGLLRVGGRVRRANLPDNTKHPIILPNKHHTTTIIIRYEHENLGHAGRNHVLSNLRTKYWIIAGNAAVRRVLASCVKCR